jgi:hypothetical protein
VTANGTGRITVQVRTIPADRLADFRVWSVLKYATGGAFYATWAAGAAEALVHHRPETISETRERLKPSARLDLSPGAGGLGATLTVTF